MKRISSYMKNTSIRMQLLSIFVAIGVAISIVTVISLSLNHQIMEKHGRNLEYISMINTLSEVNDESKDLLGELWREPPKLEKKEVIEIAQVVTTLIENIRLKTTSVDISLRLRVIEYLFEQYETKSLALIDLLEQEKVSLSQSKESSFQYTLYLEAVEMPNRINTYIQEIITYSVRENQDFLQQALNSSRILQYMLVIIVGLIFMISMYVAVKYSRYLERLISNILELTKRIATGNKIEGLEVQEGPKEMREITGSFNRLIMTMEELKQKADEKAKLELKLAEEELERSRMSELLKEAQLQGLQLQIQPHFLFNTLNVISMMALMEENHQVYDLIRALAKFMRCSLKRSTALVSLNEEVDMITQYLYILKARMGERLEYEITNQVIERVEVPLFTLQPIVENAFRHGLEEKLGKGRLIVRLTQRNNYLILRVYNDGIGMTKKKLNELRQRCNSKEVRIDQGQHIGIENVVYRLGMVFQDNVDYQIYSSTHKGTMFMIRILQQSD